MKEKRKMKKKKSGKSGFFTDNGVVLGKSLEHFEGTSI